MLEVQEDKATQAGMDLTAGMGRMERVARMGQTDQQEFSPEDSSNQVQMAVMVEMEQEAKVVAEVALDKLARLIILPAPALRRIIKL